MDDRAKKAKALEESIQHWKDNARAYNPEMADISSRSCALCNLYCTIPYLSNYCEGCPVFESTGLKYCGNTPYGKAAICREKYRGRHIDRCFLGESEDLSKKYAEDFRKYALEEVAFLESLRKVSDDQ